MIVSVCPRNKSDVSLLSMPSSVWQSTMTVKVINIYLFLAAVYSYNMSGIKAVIYDVDGTMVNSEPLHLAAWDEALHRFAHKLTDLSQEFQATMTGKKPIAIAEGMVDELHIAAGAHELLEVKTKLFLQAAQTRLEGMPGVVESTRRLADEGYELAIGTSLDRDYVNLVLDRLGIPDAFKVIVTSDEIKNGKPHPETYLTVIQRLGMQPDECVVLEDAKSGIQSARAAGAYCIAIENPDAVAQDTSQANITVSSLDGVTANVIKSISTQ